MGIRFLGMGLITVGEHSRLLYVGRVSPYDGHFCVALQLGSPHLNKVVGVLCVVDLAAL